MTTETDQTQNVNEPNVNASSQERYSFVSMFKNAFLNIIIVIAFLYFSEKSINSLYKLSGLNNGDYKLVGERIIQYYIFLFYLFISAICGAFLIIRNLKK